MSRFGMGYDVHQLVEGRKLIIGGVDIPYEKVESAVTKYIDKKEKYSLRKRKLLILVLNTER